MPQRYSNFDEGVWRELSLKDRDSSETPALLTGKHLASQQNIAGSQSTHCSLTRMLDL